MANRFPLIIDTETNQIKEIPEGDSLDFTGVGVANLPSLSVTGSLSGSTVSSSGTLSSTGNATVGGTLNVTGATTLGSTLGVTGNITGANVTLSGNVDAVSFTVAGSPLSSIQVQSDWNVGDVGSPAYIKNKPVIPTPISSIFDLDDVILPGLVATGKVLKFNASGELYPDDAAGVDLTAFSVVTNPASGNGSLSYDDGTGVFTFTPANVITTTSGLVNDANFTTLTAVDAAGYLLTGDVLNSGRITRSVVGGQVTLGFDETGLLTTESDTLDSVTTRGNLTTNTITVGAISASSGVTPSSFQDIETLTMDFGTSLTSTNGSITLTNGNLTLTNGSFGAATLTATTRVAAPEIQNTGGEIMVDASTRVRFKRGYLGFELASTLPGSPSVGDFVFTGETLALRLNDDGSGSPGWHYLGGPFAPGGFILPTFTTTERNALTARPGEMILNVSTSKLEVWDGSTWLVIGP